METKTSSKATLSSMRFFLVSQVIVATSACGQGALYSAPTNTPYAESSSAKVDESEGERAAIDAQIQQQDAQRRQADDAEQARRQEEESRRVEEQVNATSRQIMGTP